MILSLLMASGGVVVEPIDDPVYALYDDIPTLHTMLVPVGPGRDFETVNAGIEAVAGAVAAGGRALLVLDPGVYNEQVSTVAGVDLAGATGDPGDVVIENTCPTGFSPINTWGGPIWIGGITSRLLEYPDRVGTGVYSVHHHGDQLTVFERVALDGPDTGAIGMDGDEGSTTWLVEVEFLNHAGRSDQATNMHGSPGNSDALTLVYDRCRTNGLGVNYNSLDSGAPDVLHVQGGAVDHVSINGVGVVAHIDPVVPTVTAVDGVTVMRDGALPPRPTW